MSGQVEGWIIMYGGTLSLMGTPTVIHGGCHLGMHEWTNKYVQASSREEMCMGVWFVGVC